MLGQTLSHYRITGQLGAGGMSEVYLAEDTKLERKVALKLLPAEFADDSERLRRLHREAKALAALDHPNIVGVFSIEVAEGVHFLTMAHIEGETLDELIPPEGLPANRLLEFGIPLADALRAAHEHGIVHRDLKPSNIMVDHDDRLRILDFGLAKLEAQPASPDMSTMAAQTMTALGAVLGSYPYMSPEQVEGKIADARSDIFSLGVVLFQMAVGRRPFRGDTAASLVSAILRDTPPLVTEVRNDLPDKLGRIIRRCLEKDPKRRIQSALDVRRELQDLAREAGTGMRRSAVEAAGEGEAAEGTPVGPQIRSIAVLPLRNLSGDPAQEYFVDGMTEALITNLSKIGVLKVIARSSAMRYKGEDTPLPEIAAALGVDALVEGSVIREGKEVGIRAQLIEAASERVLWGDQYRRDLTSVLTLQSELARTIVRGIKVTLTPQEESLLTGARFVDAAAHEAYLRGRFHWYRFTPDDLHSARTYFERALEIDPEYALAYVGLADALATPPHIGLEPPGELFERAKAAIGRALELDPDLAEAHDLRARIAFARDWDWEGAERGFRRALELNPNLSDVHVVYSQFLAIIDRWDQVLAEAGRGVELDPLSPFSRQQLSERLSWMGRHEEAIAGLERLVGSGGDLPFVRLSLWDIFFAQGSFEQALAEARHYFRLTGQSELEEALEPASDAAEYGRAMTRAVEKMEELARQTYVSPVDFARFYAHAGQREQALKWLEKACDEHESRLVYVTVDPVFEDVRRDRRFRNLLRRMGLPQGEPRAQAMRTKVEEGKRGGDAGQSP